jgi:N-acetylneuraminic acid mutarotase
MFLFGGSSQSHENKSVYALNLVTFDWRLLSTTDGPGTLDDHTAVAFKSDMFVFGGFSDSGRTNDVWVFNTDEKKWTYREQGEDPRRFPCPRTGHAAALIGDTMWVFGGQDDETNKLNDVWAYSVVQDVWE